MTGAGRFRECNYGGDILLFSNIYTSSQTDSAVRHAGDIILSKSLSIYFAPNPSSDTDRIPEHTADRLSRLESSSPGEGREWPGTGRNVRKARNTLTRNRQLPREPDVWFAFYGFGKPKTDPNSPAEFHREPRFHSKDFDISRADATFGLCARFVSRKFGGRQKAPLAKRGVCGVGGVVVGGGPLLGVGTFYSRVKKFVAVGALQIGPGRSQESGRAKLVSRRAITPEDFFGGGKRGPPISRIPS